MKNENSHIILKINNLTIGYKTKKTLNSVASNINFSIEKGKFISVIGKNGIGKSTLLRTISGVQKKLNGDIYINKKSISDYSNRELSTTLSLVLTDFIPESQLTVYEIIALGRQPYTNWIDNLTTEDHYQINKAIDQTDLSTLKTKQFHTLSDGQKQRVLIARAFAQNTNIIILDEPTAHLDMYHTIKIFKLLKEIVKETNKTIILSSHQINLCLRLTDSIIVFNDHNVEFGSTKDLIANKSLQKLFPKDFITFDENIQQFIIP